MLFIDEIFRLQRSPLRTIQLNGDHSDFALFGLLVNKKMTMLKKRALKMFLKVYSSLNNHYK
jgi:hypothetical protein